MKQSIYTPFISGDSTPTIKLDFTSPTDFPKNNPVSISVDPGVLSEGFYKPQYNIQSDSTSSSSPESQSRTSDPESHLPFTDLGSEFSIDNFTSLLKQQGIQVRVTSGLRPGAKTKQGNQSFHSTGKALDIVPVDGDFNKLRQQISKSPVILDYMRKHGIGILDETTPEVLARTGGTGAHWHIGPDRVAISNFNNWFGIPKVQQGGVLKFQHSGKVSSNTKPRQREYNPNSSLAERLWNRFTDKVGWTSASTYTDGYGTQRSQESARREAWNDKTETNLRNAGEALAAGALGASAVAAAPAIPTILSNPWVGAGLTSYFGAHGIQRAPETIQQTKEAFQEGNTRDKVEAVSNAILNVAEVAPLVRPAKVAAQAVHRAVTPAINKAGRVVQSTYYNNAPWTWKPNPNAAYRAIPEEAIDDAIESGVIRTKPQGQTPMQKAIAEGREPTIHERLASGGSRAKGNVYFSRGTPLSYTYSNRYTTGQGSNFGTHLIEAPIERLHRIGPKGRPILDAPVGRDIPMGASATPTTPLQTSEVTLLKPSRVFGYRKVPHTQHSQIKTPFTVTEEMQPAIQEVLDDTYKVVTPMKDNPLGSRLRTGALERTELKIDPKSLFQPSTQTQKSFKEVMGQQLSNTKLRQVYDKVNSKLASRLENGTATIADFADEVKVLTPSEPYTTSIAGYYNPLDIPIVDNIHTARKSLQFKNNPPSNPEGNIGKMLQQYERNHEIQHVIQNKSNLKEFYKGTDGLSEFIDPSVLKGNWLTNGELGSRIGQLKDYYNITDGSELFNANTLKNMTDLYIKSGNSLDNGISYIRSGVTDWKKFADFANRFALSTAPPSMLWKGIRTYNNPNDKLEDYIKYKNGGSLKQSVYNPLISTNDKTTVPLTMSGNPTPDKKPNITDYMGDFYKPQYNFMTNYVERPAVQYKNNKPVTPEFSDFIEQTEKMEKHPEYRKIYQQLSTAGLDKQLVSALMGNMWQESQFDPDADSKDGFKGLFQLDKNRWADYQTYLKRNRLTNTVENQLDYIIPIIIDTKNKNPHNLPGNINIHQNDWGGTGKQDSFFRDRIGLTAGQQATLFADLFERQSAEDNHRRSALADYINDTN